MNDIINKRPKNSRKIVYLMEGLLSLLALVFLILNIVGDKKAEVYGASISAMIAGFIPFMLEKGIKKDVPVVLHISYTMYILFSNIVGGILGVFDNVWWYDKFMHASIGYLMCIIGMYFFMVTRVWDSKKIAGCVLQIFSFSMMWSSIWETVEFFADNVLSQTMQHGLIDTMYDIIFHLIFTLVFIAQFLLYKYTKYGFGMKQIISSLSKKP